MALRSQDAETTRCVEPKRIHTGKLIGADASSGMTRPSVACLDASAGCNPDTSVAVNLHRGQIRRHRRQCALMAVTSSFPTLKKTLRPFPTQRLPSADAAAEDAYGILEQRFRFQGRLASDNAVQAVFGSHPRRSIRISQQGSTISLVSHSIMNHSTSIPSQGILIEPAGPRHQFPAWDSSFSPFITRPRARAPRSVEQIR